MFLNVTMLARVEAMQHVQLSSRVAVIAPHPPYRGGISQYSERLCSRLEESGLEVVRISFTRLYPGLLFPGRSQFEPEDDKDDLAEIGTTSPVIRLIDSINPVTWIAASRRIEKDDVVLAIFMYWMPFFAPAYTKMARSLRKCGIRTIGVTHNVLPHERHAGDALLSKLFLTQCDEIVVLSDAVRRSVEGLLPASSPVLLEHPAYDQFGGPLEKTEARSQLVLGPDEKLRRAEKIILFFGVVRAYKGLHVLIDALPEIVASIPEVRLLVAGEFYDDRSEYDEKIAALNVGDHVTICDEYIPRSRVAAYFSAADLLVQPYTSATQSGVVQIAQQFGLPSIVSDVGGLADQVGRENKERIVPPLDPHALSTAVVGFFSRTSDGDESEEAHDTAGRDTIRRHRPDEVESGRIQMGPAGVSWEPYITFVYEQINTAKLTQSDGLRSD